MEEILHTISIIGYPQTVLDPYYSGLPPLLGKQWGCLSAPCKSMWWLLVSFIFWRTMRLCSSNYRKVSEGTCPNLSSDTETYPNM